jgi:hypothetical protein
LLIDKKAMRPVSNESISIVRNMNVNLLLLYPVIETLP